MANFAVDALESKVDTLHHENERLKAALNRFRELDVHDPDLADSLWAIQQEESPHDTSLLEHDACVIEQMRFPTMLRKMWSGQEVQSWLQEQADEKRRKAGIGRM
jgi:hypothetical protein